MGFVKFLGTLFLQKTFGPLLQMSRNLTLKLLILNKHFHSINIVGTLYLMSRNVGFVF